MRSSVGSQSCISIKERANDQSHHQWDGATSMSIPILRCSGLRVDRPAGTKYGCGIAQCGACTVHVDGIATRSACRSASRRQADHDVEGLAQNGNHPVQKAGSGSTAQWLLPERHDHGRGCAAKEKPKPTLTSTTRSQHLPLGPSTGAAITRRQRMKESHELRRK